MSKVVLHLFLMIILVFLKNKLNKPFMIWKMNVYLKKNKNMEYTECKFSLLVLRN